ncbi:FecR family protein [Herbaspirillum rhizosphaerae]|uniref:FecR family protein n=1 Tax=Herbaspirillum rhizosphaerae TaxID=346179 RepID=UPI00067B2881|nr:FecR domain-containing protein [Herbaspirillum rhizosphaerae]
MKLHPATAGAAEEAKDEDSIAEQAAQWIVQLTADDIDTRNAAQRGYDAWKQADPRHAAMAERLQDFIGRVQRIRGADGGKSNARPARAALDAVFALSGKAGQKRRAKRIIASMLVALCVAVPGWVATKAYSPRYLMADMHTATGKWETQVLEDGTRITLNSASAVNLHYDAGRRALELVQGEILVDVARDRARPFIVETAQGSIRALGTRFVVSREPDATVLSMLESRVEVRPAKRTASMAIGSMEAEEPVVVSAGQRVRMTAAGIGAIEQIDARSIADAWKFHQLVVQEQSLPDVLDALERHRPGAISYDRAALEGIRVSAVLPLDDTGRALQLLGSSFPMLRIRTLSPYLVRVDAPAQP